jgi:DNA-binding SARP family transcriptional activator/WD40 repeat protein
LKLSVLGPVEVADQGHVLRLRGQRQRAVLAVLAAHGPTVVSSDALIEHVWGSDAPASAKNASQVYVSQLRALMGRDRIVTEGSGYRLGLDRSEVDSWQFMDLVERGLRQHSSGDASEAAATLRSSLELWRGPAFAGFETFHFLAAEADRLTQLRLTALEQRVEAELASGVRSGLVVELETLVRDHPLREHFWSQLMRALYAEGRQTDALEAYRRVRSLLRDELGVEPGPELRDVEQAVLRQEAGLLTTSTPALPERLPAGLTRDGPSFVGRDAEIAWLLAALERAEGGQTAVVLVEGPPGCGKTRLVSQFVLLVRGRDLPVHYSTGVETLAVVEHASTPSIRILDDVEQLPAIAATDFAAHVRSDRPGTLTVICYSAGLASLPVRVALTGLIEDGYAQERTLGPLSRSEIVRVALEYEPEPEQAELSAFVSGVGDVSPLTAHEAAIAWAATRAAQRVREAAADLPVTAARAAAARDRLVGTLSEAQRARERRLRSQASDFRHRPYLGLLRYSETEAPIYFGREHQVAAVLGRLVGSRFLLLAGPSGSGKSSLVRAGVLPALAAGAIPGSEEWRRVVMTPGADPDRVLAEAMPLHERTGPPALLVLDQLEEVFTSADEGSRRRLSERLVALAADRRVRVVATVRTDFFDQCSVWEPVASWLPEALVLMAPIREPALRRIVEQPALIAGARFEDGLVDAILADAGTDPGVLPLISTALAELWACREGTKLTWAGYRESGGVGGAIDRLAEATYASMSRDQRDTARRIFLRLADVSPDGTAVKRSLRRQPDPHDGLARGVLDLLAAARLIVLDRDMVEVAHEALFTEWERLRTWLAEDAEGRRVREMVSPAVLAWEQGGRSTADLLRGPRLLAAVEYAATHPDDLTPTEREFVQASQELADTERARERRSLRRLRILAGGLIVVVLTALVAAGLAVDQQRRAQRSQSAAEVSSLRAAARGMAASAQQEVRPDRALLLAAQAVQLDETPQTRAALLTALSRTDRFAGSLHTGQSSVEQFESDPSGTFLAIREKSGAVQLSAIRTQATPGKVLARWDDIGNTIDLDFSPDGTTLALLGEFSIRLYDTSDPEASPRKIALRQGSPQQMEFADDGHIALTELDINRTVELIDVDDGRRVWLARTAAVQGLHRLQDGSLFAGAGHSWVILDENGQQTRVRLSTSSAGSASTSALPAAKMRVLVPSPDGQLMAGGDASGRTTVWEVASGRPKEVVQAHGSAVQAIAWARDSSAFASASDDATVVVHFTGVGRRARSAEGDTRRIELLGHAGPVNDLAFSPDGRKLYSAAADGQVFSWKVEGVAELASEYLSTRVRPDSGLKLSRARLSALVVSGSGPVVTLTATDPSGEQSSMVVPCVGLARECGSSVGGRHTRIVPGLFPTLSTSLSGERALLSADDDGYRPGGRSPAYLLDRSSSGTTVRKLTGLGARSIISPNGAFAAGTVDGRIDFYALDGDGVFKLRAEAEPSLFSALEAITFSPDGELLVVEDSNWGTVSVVSASTGGVVARLGVEPGARLADAAFAPGGQLLVLAWSGGTVTAWDTATWETAMLPVDGIPGRPNSISVSPSSDTLLLAGNDGVTIWDLGALPGSPPLRLPLAAGRDYRASFLTDDLVVTHTGTGPVLSWTTKSSSWVGLACARAARDLTADEWQATAPGQAPRPTCPDV